MFKKTERLNKIEFSEYFRVGKRHHFPHLTIITAQHEKRKVSVVVGKKVAKSAVRRNTLRRRVYAVLRKNLVAAEYKGVLIVVLKPTFSSLSKKTAAEYLTMSIAQVLKSSRIT